MKDFILRLLLRLITKVSSVRQWSSRFLTPCTNHAPLVAGRVYSSLGKVELSNVTWADVTPATDWELSYVHECSKCKATYFDSFNSLHTHMRNVHKENIDIADRHLFHVEEATRISPDMPVTKEILKSMREQAVLGDFRRSAPVGLPTEDKERKELELFTFMFEYFPDAWLAVVNVAVQGNKQHNPGQKLHWAREKSKDQMNTSWRHQFDYGKGVKMDTDGQYHLAKSIWRQMAQLQLDIEADRANEDV